VRDAPNWAQWSLIIQYVPCRIVHNWDAKRPNHISVVEDQLKDLPTHLQVIKDQSSYTSPCLNEFRQVGQKVFLKLVVSISHDCNFQRSILFLEFATWRINTGRTRYIISHGRSTVSSRSPTFKNPGCVSIGSEKSFGGEGNLGKSLIKAQDVLCYRQDSLTIFWYSRFSLPFAWLKIQICWVLKNSASLIEDLMNKSKSSLGYFCHFF